LPVCNEKKESLMKLPQINIQDVNDKKVLVRVDFNVPVNNGRITDLTRIEASVPTIKWLVDNGAIVFLVSHFGDASGKKEARYSLKKVVSSLSRALGKKAIFISDCIGPKRQKTIAKAKSGEVYLLENTRFYSGEKDNDPDFSKKLAEGFDLFVNDAFSAIHRAHASTVGVTKFLPSFAGLNLAAEFENLSEALEKPSKPFVAVIGGAKISSKIDVLKNLIDKVDVLIIGGGMANNFLAAEGYDIGKSLFEEDYLDSAEEIARLAYDKAIEFLLPDDVVVAKKIGSRAKTKVKAIDEVAKDEIIVDIGPKSVAKFAEPLKFAGTIFWNGPMGISEYKPSAKATEGVAKIISESKAKSVIGGGDTVSAVSAHKLKFDFVSTGGGATLELVSGHKLPGIEALK
jgi:phosphoglycerate kinase